MMDSSLNFEAQWFKFNDTEGQPSFIWPTASQSSSDCPTSQSGRSDGFGRSSPVDDDSSCSRESSPAFEFVTDPVAWRMEAAQQSQEFNDALSAQASANNNATSLPSSSPSSSDVASYDDANLDDELWDELMGVSDTDDTQMTEPQSEKAISSSCSGNTGPDEEEDEDEMIAMLTESLNKELEEMKGAQQLAAEKEAAESAQKKALLEEQMRVAAEKLALATQFDYLHEPPKEKSKTAATRKVIRRPGLIDRADRFDRGLGFDTSPGAAERSSRRRALREDRPPEPNIRTTLETPASSSGEGDPSDAGAAVQRIRGLPRAYHKTGIISWELMWDHMTLCKFHAFHISSSPSYPGAPLTVNISHEP